MRRSMVPSLAKRCRRCSGGFAHVLGANGGHHGQSAHGVQPGADHAAVDAVVGIVAHQLRPHVDARHHLLRGNAGDLEPQQLVEDDLSSKMVVSPARNSGSNTMAAAEADEADINTA